MEKKASSFRTSIGESFNRRRDKIWAKKSTRVKYHRSFRRTHREDYCRELRMPGLLSFSIIVFKTIFKNWKLFGTLLVCIVTLNIILVGLMSEDLYVSFQNTLDETAHTTMDTRIGAVTRASLLLISTVATGGLSQGMTEVQQILAIILFLIVWLVVIYLTRHLLAGNKLKFRDGLYNALTPFISTLLVFVVIFFQLIPIFIVLIVHSAAITTGFLATPFYALIYFILAAGLILLSVYMLSSSLIALVAVTAPGMYPIAALNIAADLQHSRRIKFIIRLLFLFLTLAIIWVLVMLPAILFDMWLKHASDFFNGWPIIPLFLLIMTTFSFIYVSAYIYLYYRRLLDDPH
jgi:hypothetical protein